MPVSAALLGCLPVVLHDFLLAAPASLHACQQLAVVCGVTACACKPLCLVPTWCKHGHLTFAWSWLPVSNVVVVH